jgi:hypothetical protein
MFRKGRDKMKQLKALTCFIALCFLAITLISCGSSTTKETSTKTANKVYTVNETANSGDLAVTVYGYKMLETGKYIGVEVGIKNNGTKTENILTKQTMSMEDPNGKSYSTVSYVIDSPFPRGTESRTNSKRLGCVEFSC